MLGDPKVERQKEERVATIDLISRINCVQVSVNSVLSPHFSMQESLVKVDEPLHEDLPENNGAAQREARVRTRRTFFLKNKINLFFSLGDGDGKEVWWSKTEVHAENKVGHTVCICKPPNFQLDISQVKSSNGQSQGGARRGRPKWRFA